MSKLYFGEKMKKLLLLFVFVSFHSNAGELDGKGVVCKIYGDTIGYFFESDRAFEYKISGGKEGLEVVKKDIGKYYTNENSIFINQIKISRKDLSFQKYSSFRGECEAFNDFESFKKGFNLENLIKDNKI